MCETAGAVKRIDNFLKWFGLSSVVITLGYFPFRIFLFPNSWDGLAAVVGILCVFGLPCAVCGLLQYDSTRPLYKIFTISKYVGFSFWISATLVLFFQTDKIGQTYLGSTLAVVGLAAFTLCVSCTILGMDGYENKLTLALHGNRRVV